MEQYHGTNKNTAIKIFDGKIDVTIGGGELGQGFYTGDLSHEAFSWSWHKFKKDKAVVKLTIDDDDFLNLTPECPDIHQTKTYRNKIRSNGETRIYKFHKNVIWAPVVGKIIDNFHQFKYESSTAQDYLNNETVLKKIYY